MDKVEGKRYAENRFVGAGSREETTQGEATP
jgi:hypothetical protein